jgi:PAS domain S-box-containing protein
VRVSGTSWKLDAFERLIEATPAHVAVVRLDGDEAIIDLIDPGTAAALGGERHELEGRTLRQVYPEADAAHVVDQLRRARDEGHVTYEAARDLPTGRRTFHVEVVPLGGDRYLFFARDVSAVREADRRIEQLERVADIGIYHWNAADDRLVWSDQLYRMVGYEPGEVEMNVDRFLEHVHADDREERERIIAHARDQAEVVPSTFRLIRVDGQERIVEVRAETASEDGELLYALGTMQDITGRVELERRAELLRRTTARRRTALEVHDRIVQGLSTAWLALQLGDTGEALAAVEATTANAQDVVKGLLADLATAEPLGPGDLVTGQRNDGGDAGANR